MQLKKNPKADLENKRSIFFAIGLIFSLSLAYYIIEIKTEKKEFSPVYNYVDLAIEDDYIPQKTERKKPKLPVDIPDKIEKIEDDDKRKLIDIEFNPTEITEDDPVEWIDIEAPVEEPEVIKFELVESLPKFEKHRDVEDREKLKLIFMKEIMNHVKKNFRYPEIAREQGIEGRVICEFTIDKNGIIKDINVLRGIHKSLDEEAKRIIGKIPKLIPAKQRNRNVEVSFILPITFKLN